MSKLRVNFGRMFHVKLWRTAAGFNFLLQTRPQYGSVTLAMGTRPTESEADRAMAEALSGIANQLNSTAAERRKLADERDAAAKRVN